MENETKVERIKMEINERNATNEERTSKQGIKIREMRNRRRKENAEEGGGEGRGRGGSGGERRERVRGP